MCLEKRKTFGVSEYRHMIYQENMKVCKYEDNERPIVLGHQGSAIFHFFPTRINFQRSFLGIRIKICLLFKLSQKLINFWNIRRTLKKGAHSYSVSARHRKMMRKKGHLVLRILENRLTSILLLQAINKLLTQATGSIFYNFFVT